PVRVSALTCNDESKAAANLFLHLRVSISAETAPPVAASESTRRRAGHASARARRRHESSPHLRSTHRAPLLWPSPRTTDSSRSTPSRSKQAQATRGKTSPLLPTHAPTSFLPSLQ